MADEPQEPPGSPTPVRTLWVCLSSEPFHQRGSLEDQGRTSDHLCENGAKPARTGNSCKGAGSAIAVAAVMAVVAVIRYLSLRSPRARELFVCRVKVLTLIVTGKGSLPPLSPLSPLSAPPKCWLLSHLEKGVEVVVGQVES